MDHWLFFVCLGCLVTSELWDAGQLFVINHDRYNRSFKDGTVKISGILYNVDYLSDEEMKGNIGLADFNKQRIMINRDHTSQTQRIALLHETLHILDSTYGLDLTEKQVVHLTHALVGLVTDNPELTL